MRAAGTARRPWRPALAIALLTFVCFAPTLRNGFVNWDDDRNFLLNTSWRGLAPANLAWMWTTFHLGHYVPLSWMTLGTDYVLWGMNPAGYHLTNNILHSASSAFVFLIALRLYRAVKAPSTRKGQEEDWVPAAVAALFFALHPLRVESVAWITERRDVLSEVLYLGCVLTYLRHHDATRTHAPRRWLLPLLFACALLSKATAVSLPVVMMILDVYPLRRLGGAIGWKGASAKAAIVEKLPYLALAVVAGVLSVVALPPRAQLPGAGKAAAAFYSLAFYVWKTAVPLELSPLYPMPRHLDPLEFRFVASGALLALLAAIFVVRHRTWPGVTACFAAFLVITLPMLGGVQNGPQIAADRYTYHAAPALALLVGAAFDALQQRRRLLARAAGAALVAVLAFLTVLQVGVWHDSMTFWSFVAAREPDSGLALNGLALELVSQGRLAEGIAAYGRALAADPELAEAENNMGVALRSSGETAAARLHLARAVQLDPAYADARVNLGSALSAAGDVPGAVEQFRSALAENPRLASAQFNWGNALFRSGDYAGALERYEAALAIDPAHAGAARNREVARARLALRIRPETLR